METFFTSFLATVTSKLCAFEGCFAAFATVEKLKAHTAADHKEEQSNNGMPLPQVL